MDPNREMASSVCTAQNERILEDDTQQENWKLLQTDTLNSLRPPRPDQPSAAELQSLSDAETAITSFLSCAIEKRTDRTSLSSQVNDLRDEKTRLEDRITQTKEDTQIAKERASNLNHPETKVSQQESWFPLGKPLKMESVPVLIGLGLLCLTIAFGFGMGAAGISLTLNWTAGMTTPGQVGLFQKILSYFNPLVWILILLVIVATVVAIVGFVKK